MSWPTGLTGPKLGLLATASGLVFGYVSFLLISFCLYAWVYGQGRGTGHARGLRDRPRRGTGAARGRGHAVAGQPPGPGVPGLVGDRPRARPRTGDRRTRCRPSSSQGARAMMRSCRRRRRWRATSPRGLPRWPADPGGPVEGGRGEPEVQQGHHGRGCGPARPGNCVIVTSGYHVLRAAIIARGAGLRGQVTGARTAGYYWPSAMLREFAAVFLRVPGR